MFSVLKAPDTTLLCKFVFGEKNLKEECIIHWTFAKATSDLQILPIFPFIFNYSAATHHKILKILKFRKKHKILKILKFWKKHKILKILKFWKKHKILKILKFRKIWNFRFWKNFGKNI